MSNVTPRSFDIEGVSPTGEYSGGGLFEQVKVPLTVHRKSMRERIANPSPETGMIAPDLGAFDAPQKLHVAFQVRATPSPTASLRQHTPFIVVVLLLLFVCRQAIEAFRAKHDGALPGIRDDGDLDEVVECARAFNSTLTSPLEPLPEDFIRKVAAVSRAEYVD